MRVPFCCGALPLLLAVLHSAIGSYVITTPRKWAAGSRAQICMIVSAADATAEDEIRVTLYGVDVSSGGGFWRPRPVIHDLQKTLLIPERVLKPHGGPPMSCDELTVPNTQSKKGQLRIVGRLGGVKINETKDINIATNIGQTFVQTDKYLYKAGQKVQFRILTLEGPFFKVSTETYPEIFVETPSGSRIAQWLNVTNPAGLIHLDMQLIDEPEEGVYNIKVTSPVSALTITKSFKIEDYVLPRFEVTLKPPNYLLADAEILKFEVCAMYTFGQPVKGNLTGILQNSGWGRHQIDMNFNDQIFGCKKIQVPLRTFGINSRAYFVNSISASVEVEEEGTGTVVTAITSISITRTVLTMEDIETSSYRKPELPYSNSVKVQFPDGSPGSLEPMSVCVAKVCRNMTTDAAGILRYTVPPHMSQDNPQVKALNYPRRNLPDSHRAYMYGSQYYSYKNSYYSPTNSSLSIMPDTTKLKCIPGESILLELPVLYAAANITETVLYVQVISRGQIQYWDSEIVHLSGGELVVDESSLVEPMQPPLSPFTVRGTVTLLITLPATVSPSVKIVVWYNRPDGEVVSDARELKISKCLEHKVQLSWPRERVEQGTVLPLTLTAEPTSLCSLGIVDKSVELLSSTQDSLTLDKVFEIAQRADVSSWENTQISDYHYCRKKIPPKPRVPPVPVAIVADDVSPTSVTIVWIARLSSGSDDMGITSYLVEYIEDNQSWEEQAIRYLAGDISTATVTGLVHGTTYHFRIIASNELGESKPSKVLTVTTPLEEAAVPANEAPFLPDGPVPDEMPMMDEPAKPVAASNVAEELEPVDKTPEVIPAVEEAVVSGPNGEVVAGNRKKRSFIMPPYGRHYRTDLVDALKMFDESGLYIMSDLTYETRPCIEYPGGFYGRSLSSGRSSSRRVFVAANVAKDYDDAPANEVVFYSAASDVVESSVSHSLDDSKARAYFPETWLWDLLSLDSGSVVQDLTLPDTITEWVGRAVCVHPTKGLGLSGPTSITTFTQFFIDLTILPTVKKGEIMPIKISVFNYLDASLPIRITLEASPEYEILGPEGTEAAVLQEEAGVTSVCIPKQDKETVTVRVRPLTVGAVNVTVNAVVDAAYPEQCGPEVIVNKVDRIITPITVEYEGFPREKTWTKYMCIEDLNENMDFFEEWQLAAPEGIVPESERAWVTVVGDLLGPTLENLGSLIKMPYGCGEQNMLNFAPNIFVYQYLEAAALGNEATYEKLKKFMKSGYQRELNYKHRDGSYSAFGESDNSGSTWLTAFVVKSFAQARPYISVDATELSMSTDWLVRRQLENGCFESVGKVLHKGMKGGLSAGGSPVVLSAYVMAALLEAGHDPTSKEIAQAVYCLQASSKGGANIGPYEAALKAHALTLARLPEAEQAVTDLMNLAIDTPSGLYWEVPNPAGSSHRGSKSGTKAVAVETAGYALMALMNFNPELYKTQGHRLVKWISSQRNSQGGFISTQDTVVALQALALYESHQSQEPLDLSVSVIGNGVAADFKVLESNKLLTQRVEIQTVPTNVMLDMAGTGCALVQGVVRYNVKDPEPSEAFSISVSTSNDYSKKSCKSKKIRTCASYLLNDLESNMAVIEITLVSGYIPEKKDLKRIVGYGTGIIKRYEVDGSKVLFYVDQFTQSETCVEFGVLEEVAVENAKPGTVKVYDYYAPEFSVSAEYTLPHRWDCSIGPPIVEPIPLPFLDDVMVFEEAIPVEAVAITEPQPNVDALLEALEELP